ncbi:hypothetical protein NV379_13315 [Paenibacillus sp. N1-5-1-14]|nr:hypothetical protein [Paenibacillus radicibacter]MCR8643630.1 hypothetical protein [Paenibacillus radicibacter]
MKKKLSILVLVALFTLSVTSTAFAASIEPRGCGNPPRNCPLPTG